MELRQRIHARDGGGENSIEITETAINHRCYTTPGALLIRPSTGLQLDVSSTIDRSTTLYFRAPLLVSHVNNSEAIGQCGSLRKARKRVVWEAGLATAVRELGDVSARILQIICCEKHACSRDLSCGLKSEFDDVFIDIGLSPEQHDIAATYSFELAPLRASQ